MNSEAYKKRLAALELTQVDAGKLLGVTGRTGQNWAAHGPPKAVAMLLVAVGRDRGRLERLARRCERASITET